MPGTHFWVRERYLLGFHQELPIPSFGSRKWFNLNLRRKGLSINSESSLHCIYAVLEPQIHY